MAVLNKRVQVLLPGEQWGELTYIAAENRESAGHMIRQAINQVYFPQSHFNNIPGFVRIDPRDWDDHVALIESK